MAENGHDLPDDHINDFFWDWIDELDPSSECHRTNFTALKPAFRAGYNKAREIGNGQRD